MTTAQPEKLYRATQTSRTAYRLDPIGPGNPRLESKMRNPSLDYEDDWVYVRHDAGAQGAIPDAWSVYRANGCAGWSLIAAMWGTREQAIARGHNLNRRDSRELAAEALDALDRSTQRRK